MNTVENSFAVSVRKTDQKTKSISRCKEEKKRGRRRGTIKLNITAVSGAGSSFFAKSQFSLLLVNSSSRFFFLTTANTSLEV